MRDSGYDRAANDWYVEDRRIVDALLKVETFDGDVLDPACGSGNIPRAINEAGGTATGSDIADRGYGETYVDFFRTSRAVANIVSNPPYGVIEPFIRHALSLATGKVCILARLAFLEGMKRKPFFETTPLARVWVSSRRVSMPPGGSGIEAKGGTVAFCWLVWERGFVGKPTVGWVL